jgi:hypothetical protein
MFSTAPPSPVDDRNKKKQSHRDRMAERSRAKSKEVAEIGPPPARNEKLWERYRLNLPAFLAERFPHSTGKCPYGKKQLKYIEGLQATVLEGGLENILMFRGGSKSTITENTAIWACGYGHRNFFPPIAATDEAAMQMVDSIQMEIETNDLLMEIFPALCHAARALEGVPQRAKKQTIEGKRSLIEWTTKRCVFPTVEGFEGSGAIIWPRSITARGIRGMRFKRPDGEQARPDFFALDDFQTDETAANPQQCTKHLRTIRKTILRLAGHDKEISGVCNATPIETDDAVEQLASDPAWRTTRIPLLEPRADGEYLPTNMDLWREYRRILSDYDEDDTAARGKAREKATAFYKKNRKAMDAGCTPNWPDGPRAKWEISAVQHALNIYFQIGDESFLSECQVSPLREVSGLERLTLEEICAKQSDYGRGVVPPECTVVVCKVDVHPSILYADVWAFEPGFTGYLVDEVHFPDQKRRYFAHASHPVKMQTFLKIKDNDAAIMAGLDRLLHGTEEAPGLMHRAFTTEKGVPLRITQCGIDGNGQASDVVNKFIRGSKFGSLMYAEYGRGVTARQKIMDVWPEAKKQPKSGPKWINTQGGPGQPRGSMYDTNYWKARHHRALALPPGARGGLYLYKTDNPANHKMRAEHYLAEPVKEVTHEGNRVFEFDEPKGDNHKFDTGVGSMVAASRAGISSLSDAPKKKSGGSRRKVKYSDGH